MLKPSRSAGHGSAAGRVPVLYLPGYSRQDLRAVESCPEPIKLLAELQYRGVIWSQINAKDWTILAYLKSEQGGLGLDVALDNERQKRHATGLDPPAGRGGRLSCVIAISTATTSTVSWPTIPFAPCSSGSIRATPIAAILDAAAVAGFCPLEQLPACLRSGKRRSSGRR